MRAFPKEERGINRFFAVFEKILKAMDALTSLEGGLFSMLGFLLKHPSMMKYSRIPYQKLLDEVTSDRRLQAVLNAHHGTYGLPPARASVIPPLSLCGALSSLAYTTPKVAAAHFVTRFSMP